MFNIDLSGQLKTNKEYLEFLVMLKFCDNCTLNIKYVVV